MVNPCSIGLEISLRWRDEEMDFLKKRLKRLTSMGLALLLSASAFPATAFAASDSTSTLAEVTAKYIDAENGKEIAEQEIPHSLYR